MTVDPRPRQRGVGGLRLFTLLILFGASLVVPATIAMGLILEHDARVKGAETEYRLEQVASDLLHDIDRETTFMSATVSTLAASPALTSGAFDHFHAWASGILTPVGLNVLYRDLDGQQLLNTRRAYGQALPRELLPAIDAAVRDSGKPYVSDMLVGAVRGDFVITVTAPVLVDNTLRGFLHLSINPERMRQIMQDQQLPEAWNTRLSDRNDIVIAQLRDHARHVGTKLPAAQRDRRGTEVFRADSLDGAAVIRASRVSALTGWAVSAEIPASLAQDAFLKHVWSVLAVTAGLLAIALLAAILVARLIAGPIGELADFAVMVEKERVPPPMRSKVREANEVAAALRLSSERLAERTGELREVVNRFNAALRGADIVVFVQGLDRKISWISASAGYRARGFVGQSEETLVDMPEERAGAIALREKVLATGEPQEGELRLGAADAARYFRQRLEAMRDGDGRVVGVLGVSVEITKLKHEQARNAMLVQELAHRSKNLLTIVQVIANATLRSAGPENFRRSFDARLGALATLQDLVVLGTRDGVRLGELIEGQLSPFVDPGPRLAIDGPDTRLRPAAANALGMALHELATNALKYGGLSLEGGKVSIQWRFEPDGAGARRLRLRWSESGGPPVVAPPRRGFGTSVVSDMTAASLRGRVTLEYRPEGLFWMIDAPADAVVA